MTSEDTKNEEPQATAEESKVKKLDDDVPSDNGSTTVVAADDIASVESPSPSVTVSLLIYWILPVLILAFVSHFLVDTTTTPKPKIPKDRPKPTVPSSRVTGQKTSKQPSQRPSSSPHSRTPSSSSTGPKPSPLPTAHSNWPTSYRDTIETIKARNRKVPRAYGTSSLSSSGGSIHKSSSSSSSSGRSSKTRKETSRGAHRDTVRQQMEERIDAYRDDYQDHPDDILKAIRLADALRMYDVTYHDGGTKQPEALQMYEKTINMALAKKGEMIENGQETDRTLSDTRNVREEVMMDYSQKSVDGMLCALYTANGKVFFMANMFEKAVESYSKCLEIEPFYLDALSSRGSSLLILGRYEDAGKDLLETIENDAQNLFADAYTGLARILQAKEETVPAGWDPITSRLDKLIPDMEGMLASIPTSEGKKMIQNTLNRLHHVMFTYHDVKTGNKSKAWDHLTESYKHKMAALPPWQSGFERQKIEQTMSIFHRGFWPDGVGSQSKIPVFIVGFVRSGSTLLERVLDAHHDIVGTGEDSVFNGRLDSIRNRIVEASMSGDPTLLASVVKDQAESVTAEMKTRWEKIYENTDPEYESTNVSKARPDPKRFVDKMLNNYYNIGFIHMLFPNALILHVVREPMDTIFSAYKHEFPAGTLDYTSDFKSLAELYHSYRDLMDHWDKELPGRVSHVRYEDMVHDMEGVAKAIIEATGLEWTSDVLNFHKKKHAVNTLSTTQVRKGVYRDSLESWRKYEDELQPLVKLIGDRVSTDRTTTLPGYSPPSRGEQKESASG